MFIIKLGQKKYQQVERTLKCTLSDFMNVDHAISLKMHLHLLKLRL